jgi:hypothetical protein
MPAMSHHAGRFALGVARFRAEMESPAQLMRFNPGQLEIVSLAPNRAYFPYLARPHERPRLELLLEVCRDDD